MAPEKGGRLAAGELVRATDAWVKSHGLGNDYLVFDGGNVTFDLDGETVARLCDRHYGVGSDGMLLRVASSRADFGLRIFNPDGSEAEKSGNGLRIFADYLYHFGFTEKKVFRVEVGGGIVECRINTDDENNVLDIEISMGRATFVPGEIPVLCDKDEAIDVPLELPGNSLMFSAVSVGNPHAVFLVDRLAPSEARKFGPSVENHPIFPNRTNVQFARVLDRENVQIEIWERGAGYTLASGSSSCAVAAVLYRKGLVGDRVKVHMPGGVLEVSVTGDFALTLKGPVTRVACGVLL